MKSAVWIAGLFVVMISVGGCNTGRETAQKTAAEEDLGFQQMYFEEAKAAVEYYMDCVSKQEYMKAINACAVVEPAKQLDFNYMVERLHTYTIRMQMPNEPQYLALNQGYNYAQQVDSLRYFLLSLCSPEKNIADIWDYEEAGGAEGIRQSLSPDKLKDFKLLRCEPVLVEGGRMEHMAPKVKESWQKQYGCEDMMEFLALYQADGETFIGGIRCMKYAEGWVVKDLSGMFVETSIMGAEVGTPEEYEKMLDEIYQN